MSRHFRFHPGSEGSGIHSAFKLHVVCSSDSMGERGSQQKNLRATWNNLIVPTLWWPLERFPA